MYYLTERDYLSLIKIEVFNHLFRDQINNRFECESMAVETIKSFIRNRFDLSNIFPLIVDFDNATTYPIGTIVYENEETHTVLEETNGNPTSNDTYFKKGDSRNYQLKEILIDITLYNMHANISGQNIPEIRYLRYERAMSVLDQIAKGIIIPNLPAIDENQDGNPDKTNYKYGSNTKLKHGY